MNNLLKIIAAVVLITTAFLIIFMPSTEYEKLEEEQINKSEINKEKESQKELENELIYRKYNIDEKGFKQRIHVILLKNKSRKYRILPVLSHDSIFGFEKTSIMAKRKNAKAAINGSFFYPFGQPSGILIKDSNLICTPRIKNVRDVFIQNKDFTYEIKKIYFSYFIKTSENKLDINGVNREPGLNDIIVFTDYYGSTNRCNGLHHLSVFTKNKSLFKKRVTRYKDEIADKEYVITATGSKIKELESFFNKNKENKLELLYTCNYKREILDAFEGGFMLVEDGVSVVDDKENWVGLTTNREPRTAIGIKYDKSVLFIVVDGRQPKYSVGFTGKELANYMIQMGVKDAIMLDGGASSTMVIDNEVVNSPSYRNEERNIGGCICIIEN